MALVLDAAQFARYHERLAQNFRPIVLRGMRAGAARALDLLVHRTRTAPPANPAGKGSGGAVNTGNLARRWRRIPLADGVALVNDAPYSPIVDGGRRPGKFPPRAPLIAWIKRRLLTKTPVKKRRWGPRPTRDQQRALADKKRLEAGIRRVGGRDPKYGPRKPTREPPKPKRVKGQRKIYSLDEQAARLYFPIARAIARRGLIARKILSDPGAQREILDMVTRGVVDELAREIGRT